MALDILIPIVEKIGDNLVAPIGRQFGYLICYNRNIENLRELLEKLEDKRNGVQEQVDVATRNGEEIRKDVKKWMKQVDEFKIEAMKFLDNIASLNKWCCNGWFPNLMTCYGLGKDANKKTTIATQLKEEGKFDVISNPAPPLGIVSMSSENFVAYETTNLAMMKVMEALKNENINFIGIHGMGGVGKTTMVKEIGKKAKEENIFDEVVMSVVSQNIDVKKIQDQMADMLGLTYTEQSDTGRASRLYSRLKDVKRILVILDDVWARLDLAIVGIPFGNDHKGCKIIITTRRIQVCNAMGMGSQTSKVVYLDVLSEQESWDLLRRNAGDGINSPTLNPMAKAIAKECRGLPVALITVGRAMRGKDPEEWKEAVEELKKAIPRHIEGVDQDVYRCIRLSYDYLADEESKSCFLLCSFFPEDHHIPVETLVLYAVGLRIFKNVDTIRDTRRRANTVINSLKISCLLISSERERCVKMHDVVRDVAISIGSDKYLVRAGVGLKEWPSMESLDQYTSISLMYNDIRELPDVCEIPSLQIMLLRGNELSCKNSFFDGTKALRVLDLSNLSWNPKATISLMSLCFLTNLRTLVLEGMQFVDTIGLEQMKTLEVLNLKNCNFLEPCSGLRKLSNLRLLDMSFCLYETGVDPCLDLSNMSRLEELYLARNDEFTQVLESPRFIKWDFASADVMESFPRLNTLILCIKAQRSLPEDFVCPDLDIFNIYYDLDSYHPTRDNYLELCDWKKPARWWANCFKVLLKKTSYLSVRDSRNVKNIVPIISSIEGEGLNALKTLEVSLCNEFEYLIEEWEVLPPYAQKVVLLSNLEDLILLELRNFKGICNGVIPSTISIMSKLRNVKIGRCPNLFGALFPSYLLPMLHQLETIQIVFNSNLEQIFDFELGEHHDELMLLSNLRILQINHLKRLKQIWNCRRPNRLAHLHNLRVLDISYCHKLKNVFQLSVAPSLQQVEVLNVYICEDLEEIVEKENQEEDEILQEDKIVFKSLKILKLGNLPNLNGFYMGRFPFEWPSLEVVHLTCCPKMKTFAATSSTPKLEEIYVDYSNDVGHLVVKLEGMDLNTIIYNRFKGKEEMQTVSGVGSM